LSRIKEFFGIQDDLDMVKSPSLDNAWLSGFTDREGCFAVGFKKTPSKVGYGIRLRYILDQNDGLNLFTHIINLLGGTVYLRENKNTYRYTLTAFRLQKAILKYFDLFPLKSKKRQDFEFYKKIYIKMRNKEHLKKENLYLFKKWVIDNSVNKKNNHI